MYDNRNNHRQIHKSVWRVRSANAKHIALQFPEGLLMYACIIADILERFAGAEQCTVLGDVTYGACCIDDLSARALHCDLLIHYGHSCLVPVDHTTVPCLYVFVDIKIDTEHLLQSIRLTFPAGTRLTVAGTIQFAASVQHVVQQLRSDYPLTNVPQAKPLSPGEVLGCTAPVLQGDTDAIVFVADGRFHLEAMMIANPTVPAYRYDPYGRILTIEEYDQRGMRAARRAAVQQARAASQWGVVLGTLGRQGNPSIMNTICSALTRRNLPHCVILLSEVSPAKLARFSGIEAWVQIACPRLSIDWGEGFTTPTLTPYEALVALGEVPGWWEGTVDEDSAAYPMDYYARDGGVWSSSYAVVKGPRRGSAAAVAAAAVST